MTRTARHAPAQFTIADQSKPVERRWRRVTGLRRRDVARSAGPPAKRPPGSSSAAFSFWRPETATWC